jgi:galactokinase
MGRIDCILDINGVIERFFEIYGGGESYTFFSPSRINLIGEHIDYNGGIVMPCATMLGTYGVVRKRNDNIIRLVSENIALRVETSINDLEYDNRHGWANYAKGVIYYILKCGYKTGGMDILISGNIPEGAGLSSSASLELLIGEMVNILYNEGMIGRIELIKLCQQAENNYVGVRCGIMDQFAIGMGKKNSGIILNCDTLEYKYIELNLQGYALIIMDTNKKRQLSDSKYNERRSECEEALRIIKEHKKIDHLCQLSTSEFNKYRRYIENDKIRKRAQHVVEENHRVKKAGEALENNDIKLLGNLLTQSHNSLRDLYEVTGEELDTIVDAANSIDDCIGARMIGAGFGGCAIALVKAKGISHFTDRVAAIYKEKIKLDSSFYITRIGDGTKLIGKSDL